MNTYVCVAGTFDGIHAGHEALLLRAYAEGAHVLIGMTSDRYVRAHKIGAIRAYISRHADLLRWVEEKGFIAQTTIVSIDDPFEPAASDASLEALIVSDESKANGEALNARRVVRGLSPLVLIVVPLVPADDMRPISATRVRAGEIDRVGRLVMPDTLRNDLSAPIGRIVLNEGIQRVLKSYVAEKKNWLITVGDMTTKTFLDAGVTPHFMIVDNKINRTMFMDLQTVYAKRGFRKLLVRSGPGFISHDALNAIHGVLSDYNHTPVVLEVDGEEDLLTLPVVSQAPIGSVVYYGQPKNQGIVEVVVSEHKKQVVSTLLSQFLEYTL